MPLKRIWTADELSRMTNFAYSFEMLGGVLHPRNNFSDEYTEIGFDLGLRLGAHVTEHRLGRLFTSQTRFLVSHDPETVLHPDASFVRSDRLDGVVEMNDGVLSIVPDLVIDIVALIEPYEDAKARVDLYRRTGVPLVWMIRPSRRSVIVAAPGARLRTLHENASLDGGDVLPGFRLPVADIFR